jgi:hypothetical protein
MDKNPISSVRQSAKRERVPDVLTVAEIAALLTQLREPCKTAVFVVFSTGVRVSELLGLKWEDVHFDTMEILPSRGIVDQFVDPLNNRCQWQAGADEHCTCGRAIGLAGEMPVQPRRRLHFRKSRKGWTATLPALQSDEERRPSGCCACGNSKAHRLAFVPGNLGDAAASKRRVRQNDETTQDMLRHATSRLTLDLYAQGTMPEKRMAQSRVTQAVGTAVVPMGTVVKSQVVVGA